MGKSQVVEETSSRYGIVNTIGPVYSCRIETSLEVFTMNIALKILELIAGPAPDTGALLLVLFMTFAIVALALFVVWRAIGAFSAKAEKK
ncbi:MAG: hypothetical protein ABSC19_18515 [Syntrophorhabdales bacterium]